jgi:hypothetical protein
MVLVGIAPAVSAASAASGKAKGDLHRPDEPSFPLAAYNGTISGYPATRPAAGTKLQADSASAKKYRAPAREEAHGDGVARRKGAHKIYDYTSGFNGFAAGMTSDAAAALRRPRVSSA